LSVDLRALFSHIGIMCTDSKRYSTRGNVSIACPFCGDDPGQHLGISDKGLYNCWRDPRHSGNDLVYILLALGMRKVKAVQLISEFEQDKPTQQPARQAAAINSNWTALQSAAESELCLDYLSSRGFSDPGRVSRQFDLRFTKHGLGAWRLLFPMRDAHTIRGWTGRALRDHVMPKYLTNCEVAASACISGRLDSERLILVEGPMDALKINCAAPLGFGAAAILGKSLPLTRLALFSKLYPKQIYVCLDNDASSGQVKFLTDELSTIAPACQLRLPRGRKDAGEMPEPEITAWLSDL
jgi:hypothetical protein